MKIAGHSSQNQAASKPIIIIGAGGHGRVVLDIIRCAGNFQPVGFIDAEPSMAGRNVAGVPVLGAWNLLPKLLKQNVRHAIVAIGDNRTRLGYSRKLAAAGMECVSVIHPAACVSESDHIGRNVVVAAGAIIGAEAIVHDGALINSGAIVEHECIIEAAAHVCPGAKLAGRVHVGEGAFIGLGAAVIQCLTVGEYAIVGAGAVVIDDVPAGATVVGVPAKIIQSRSAGRAAEETASDVAVTAAGG